MALSSVGGQISLRNAGIVKFMGARLRKVSVLCFSEASSYMQSTSQQGPGNLKRKASSFTAASSFQNVSTNRGLTDDASSKANSGQVSPTTQAL